MTAKSATPGLVLGIIALVCGVISWFALAWLCIPALVLGIIAIALSSGAKKSRAAAGLSTGGATGGFVCGLLGLIFGALGCILWISCVICVASLV